MDAELTPAEERAIKALEKLAKTWPKSLWLYSASGSLNVMKKCNGQRVMLSGDGRIGPDWQVETILGIENDGGDW